MTEPPSLPIGDFRKEPSPAELYTPFPIGTFRKVPSRDRRLPEMAERAALAIGSFRKPKLSLRPVSPSGNGRALPPCFGYFRNRPNPLGPDRWFPEMAEPLSATSAAAPWPLGRAGSGAGGWGHGCVCTHVHTEPDVQLHTRTPGCATAYLGLRWCTHLPTHTYTWMCSCSHVHTWASSCAHTHRHVTLDRHSHVQMWCALLHAPKYVSVPAIPGAQGHTWACCCAHTQINL